MVYEKINYLIRKQGLSKSKFIDKLLLLEPKLSSTGEVPLKSSIYGYLNGQRELKVELLPYISEVLQIPIDELFYDNSDCRRNYISYLLDHCKNHDLLFIKNKILNQDTNLTLNQEIIELISLLEYGSKPLLDEFITKLKTQKDILD